MTDIRQIILGVLVLLLGIVAFSSMYTVTERDQALVLQLGKVKRLTNEPGLHLKYPWPFENVVYYDKRVLDFDAKAEEIPTRDQKQIVVDSFARYRIIDPLLFFQRVTNEQGMASRLDKIINANLRAVFGEVELAVVLTPKRAELMSTIAQRVKLEGKAFGINVLDVRLRRVDLPEENSQAIFRRMQTQREQEARRIRAEGDKESRRIRAEARQDRADHRRRSGPQLRDSPWRRRWRGSEYLQQGLRPGPGILRFLGLYAGAAPRAEWRDDQLCGATGRRLFPLFR